MRDFLEAFILAAVLSAVVVISVKFIMMLF